jgi:hypothetical protein
LEAGGEGEGRAAEEGAEGTGEEVFSLDCRALRLPQSTSITKVTEREREREYRRRWHFLAQWFIHIDAEE